MDTYEEGCRCVVSSLGNCGGCKGRRPALGESNRGEMKKREKNAEDGWKNSRLAADRLRLSTICE